MDQIGFQIDSYLLIEKLLSCLVLKILISPAINPIIYSFFGRKFQSHIRKILCLPFRKISRANRAIAQSARRKGIFEPLMAHIIESFYMSHFICFQYKKCLNSHIQSIGSVS